MTNQDDGTDLAALTEADRAFGQRARSAAHRPTVAVSGPYGHPVHPLLVTVPIGAFVSAVAFDIASKTVEAQAYRVLLNGSWRSASCRVSSQRPPDSSTIAASPRGHRLTRRRPLTCC